MDNDLMARRLRPPSEPAPAPQPQPMAQMDSAPPEQDQFPWETEEGPDPLASAQAVWAPAPAPLAPPTQPMAVEPSMAPFAPSVSQPTSAPFAPPTQPVQPHGAVPFTWPTAGERAPWDRPSEYAPPTDLFDPDQPAWDQPSPTDWIDPEQVDDRTPDMLETFASRQMSNVAAVGAPAAWPPANTAPEQKPRPSEEPRPIEPNAADPYDADAPVLGDVAAPASRPWAETNGPDHGRNAPTVSGISTAVPAAAPVDLATNLGEHARAHDVGSAVGSTFTLREPSAGPPIWATDDAAVTVRIPVAPSGMGAGGRGPTPPAELFENVTVIEARLVAPDPQGVVPAAAEDGADEPSPTQAVSLYSNAPPTPLVVRIELAFVDGSRRVANAAENARRVGPGQADEGLVNDVDSVTEKFMPRHPDFEPRGPRAPEVYDVPPPAASPFEAPAARPSPITTEASALIEHAPIEPFARSPLPTAPLAPFAIHSAEPQKETDWIEPTAEAQPPSAGDGDPAIWPSDFALGSESPELTPPWIQSPHVSEPQPAPSAAQDHLAPDETFPPLAPLPRPAAPMSVADAAPAWFDRAHVVDPLSLLPAALAPTHSAWPHPFQQSAPAPTAAASSAAALPAAAPFAAPVGAPSVTPAPESFSAPAPEPFSAPAETTAPASDAGASVPVAPRVIPRPSPRPSSHELLMPIAATPAAPSLSASGRTDQWFLSTEPYTAAVDGEDAFRDAIREPSPIITATLTIGMAVLVIVLFLVFIQLMTSLLG